MYREHVTCVTCVQGLDSIVKALSGSLKVKGDDLPARLAALQVGMLCGAAGWGGLWGATPLHITNSSQRSGYLYVQSTTASFTALSPQMGCCPW
jgi:hypothetical protein